LLKSGVKHHTTNHPKIHYTHLSHTGKLEWGLSPCTSILEGDLYPIISDNDHYNNWS